MHVSASQQLRRRHVSQLPNRAARHLCLLLRSRPCRRLGQPPCCCPPARPSRCRRTLLLLLDRLRLAVRAEQLSTRPPPPPAPAGTAPRPGHRTAPAPAPAARSAR
eukprot:6000321-Prymnesium_polylepis.1